MPAVASTDVSRFLAEAPSSDWVASDPSPSDLVGPITAQSYAAWTHQSYSVGQLNRAGFVTGYGLAWEQKLTQDYLSEFVLEFKTADGATSWYNGLKLYDQTSKYYQKDVPAVSTAHSVGVQWKFSDGSREWAFELAKGNLFFDVTMDADTNDLAATALAQAQTMFDKAPDAVDVASTTPALSTTAGWVIGLSLVAFCVLVAGVIFILVRSSQRQPVAQALGSAGVQMSPDGAYWWDGARWRFTATDPPPR